MLHPTQNRPPRAQAIKNRREAREWGSRPFKNRLVGLHVTQPSSHTPHWVKWSDVSATNPAFADEAKPTQEVSHG